MEKLKIKGEEGESAGVEVEALFNPKEMGIDKTVPWKANEKAEADAPPQEFTTGQPKTLSFDLMADLFEEEAAADKDVYTNFVAPLQNFALIDKGLKRPPMVTVAWSNKFPAFKGVIASMNVKYTMFLPDGTPCRCTVSVKVTEAKSAAYKGKDSKKKNKKATPGAQKKDGQRADQLADSSGSSGHRQMGESNNIDDLGNVPNGTNVSRSG